jgi:hypothetical protein
LIDEQTPLFIQEQGLFSSSLILDLFGCLCHSIGIPPPTHSDGMSESESVLCFSASEYHGQDILPYSLCLFTKGLQGISRDSISFKRIQNRISTLPALLCKQVSNLLTTAVCVISLLKASLHLFGSHLYTESIHQTLVNLITNQESSLEEERQYLSWYLSLVLFLPSQGTQLTLSSSLGRLGFSFLFTKFQLILEEILSQKSTKGLFPVAHSVTLICLLPIIDGMHSSKYLELSDASSGTSEHESRIRLIFSLWNGTLRMRSAFEDEKIQLELCVCGLNRFFSNISNFLLSESIEKIR